MLLPLFDSVPITETDGKRTLWNSSDIFAGYRDDPELELLNVPGKPTSPALAIVSEVDEDVSTEQIIESFGSNLAPLNFGQGQIAIFGAMELARRKLLETEGKLLGIEEKKKKPDHVRLAEIKKKIEKLKEEALFGGHGYYNIFPFTREGEPVATDKSNLLLAAVLALAAGLSVYQLSYPGGSPLRAEHKNRFFCLKPGRGPYVLKAASR